MKVIQTAAEIDKIQGVLANFAWKLVKQEITDQELILTIKQEVPLASDTKPTE